MAATKLADLIVPEVFLPYASKRITEKLILLSSGIMTDLSDVASIVEQRGGITVNMPYLDDLDGDDELLDDTVDLTINNIGSGQDVAIRLARGKVFGATDIAADLSGADPLADIANKYADYWAKRIQAIALATLDGAMATVAASASMADNTLDISALTGAASDFDAPAFIDATARLGDRQDDLAGILIHSDTYTSMKKLDLIDYEKDSEGKPTIPYYQGKRVLVSDKMGKAGSPSTYTSYLFGPGSLGFAQWDPDEAVETERDGLKSGGTEWIVHRRHMIAHIRGIKWAPASGVPAKATPTNAELAGAGNWARVYPANDIKIVRFKHTVAA